MAKSRGSGAAKSGGSDNGDRPVKIKSETELSKALEALREYYCAMRMLYRATPATLDGAARFAKTGGQLVVGITATLAAIEEFTGTGDARVLLSEMAEVARDRASTEAG